MDWNPLLPEKPQAYIMASPSWMVAEYLKSIEYGYIEMTHHQNLIIDE